MEKINDHIDQYLLNTLTAEEKQAFEKQLKQDEALQEEVVFRKKMLAGLEQLHVGQLVEQFAAFEKKNNTTVPSIPSPIKPKRKLSVVWNRQYLAIAAGLALIILTGIVYYVYSGEQRNSNQQLFSSYYNPPDNQSLMEEIEDNMSGFANQDKERWIALQEGMIAYENKNFGQAEGLLEQYVKTFPSDFDARFYLAITKFQLDKTNEGRNILIQLENSYQKDERDIISWYLALAYVKLNQEEAAKELLTELLQKKEGVYYEQVNQLLKAINEL